MLMASGSRSQMNKDEGERNISSAKVKKKLFYNKGIRK